jgi:hypothetical protein
VHEVNRNAFGRSEILYLSELCFETADRKLCTYVLEIHSKPYTKTFLVTLKDASFRNGPVCNRLVKFCLEKFLISVCEHVSPTCIWNAY